MRSVLCHKVAIPSWFFLLAIFIQSFAPAATKEYGWLLLMVAFTEANLTVAEPGALRKVNTTISAFLKLLWLFGFGFSLMK